MSHIYCVQLLSLLVVQGEAVYYTKVTTFHVTMLAFSLHVAVVPKNRPQTCQQGHLSQPFFLRDCESSADQGAFSQNTEKT